MSHLINFTWEPEYLDAHYNSFDIQISDGATDYMGGTHWDGAIQTGTSDLLWMINASGGEWPRWVGIGEERTIEPQGPISSPGPGKLTWSIVITPDGTARLFDALDATGTIRREEQLDSNVPWYLRFVVNDATSGGNPGGDARLNLYSFQSAVESHYSARVTVNNAPPNVYAGADTATDEGHFFTQLGSFADPGADIWTASVDYGDGTGVQPLTCDEKNKTFELNHAYADDGIYTVTVRNRDDDMATDQRFPAALKTERCGEHPRGGAIKSGQGDQTNYEFSRRGASRKLW